MTEFNKRFPGAFDFELGSNKVVWGVWFRLPHKKHKVFKALKDFQGNNKEQVIVESLEKLPNEQIFLFEEDRVLGLN